MTEAIEVRSGSIAILADMSARAKNLGEATTPDVELRAEEEIRDKTGADDAKWLHQTLDAQHQRPVAKRTVR